MIKLNKLLFLFCLLTTFCGSSQAQFLDSFNYSGRPDPFIWQGDLDKFIVQNGTVSSQSQVANDLFYISTPLQRQLEEGFIQVRLDFNTSSKNFLDIVLWSNHADFDALLDGVFLRIGGTKDCLELFEIRMSQDSSLFKFQLGQTHKFNGQIKWKYDNSDGKLIILHNNDSATAYCSFIPPKLCYTGLRIQQSTQSFFSKHHISNMYWGKEIRDTLPPEVVRFKIIDSSSVHIVFSEPMDQDQGIGIFEAKKMTATWLSDTMIKFDVNDNWPVGIHFDILLEGFMDVHQIGPLDSSIQLKFEPVSRPTRSDILFSELMIDPDPSVGLANREFIELYNRSNKYINLGECFLKDQNKYQLESFILHPGSFVALVDKSKALPSDWSNSQFHASKLPGLNNGGERLKLFCHEQEIDSVTYDESWLRHEYKQNGGWSMERIDLNEICQRRDNWEYSKDNRGGTPGEMNSVRRPNPDVVPPYILTYGLQDDKILLWFNEDIDTNAKTDFKLLLSNAHITGLYFISNTKCMLSLSRLPSKSEIVQLHVDGIKDCSGNQSQADTILLAQAEPISRFGIQFNEIMFDPFPHSAEFVELVNVSKQVFDLAQLSLAKKAQGRLKDLTRISKNSKLMFPGDIVLLSRYPNKISPYYPLSQRQNFLEVSEFPLLSNSGDWLFLVNNKSEIVDSVEYSPSQHFDMLQESQGVSLEKLAPQAHSYLLTSWVSASETSQGASPGAPNTQRLTGNESAKFSLTNRVFSPNNDGYKDRLEIRIEMAEPLSMVLLQVYSVNAVLIRELLPRTLVDSNLVLYWDGLNNENRLVPQGTYIIVLNAYTASGEKFRQKQTVQLMGNP